MERRDLLKCLGAAAVLFGLPSRRLFAEAPEPPAAEGPASAAGAGIFVDQVGYGPGDAKVATVRGLGEEGAEFAVRTHGGGVVSRGRLGAASLDEASGDRVCRADFSDVRLPGRYQMEVGGQVSDPFAIGPAVYAGALRSVTRAFYGQRCGCKVNLGGGYKHGRCHKHGAFHASSGRNGKVRNAGGWHDAGDYGRYVVNSGITTGTLLWAWEMYPGVLAGLELGIPESGRGMPDLLAEVKWNLDWMLSLQDNDGGVWHKQTSEKFCAFIMPQKDHLTSYIIGTGSEPYKSTAATADLASVAAIAARCYAVYAPEYARRCLAAARRAWDWAAAHPDVAFQNPPGVTTGEYGDRGLGDEMVWASAELWRTTGEAKFEQRFLAGAGVSSDELTIGAPGWNSLASMGCWTYAMAERPGLAEVKQRVRRSTAEAARRLLAQGRTSGYGNTLEMRQYGWGSNSVAANQSLLLLVADRFQPAAEFRDAAFGNMHYLLGRNCHGVSWVTQVGVRPFQHPHHRPSAADGIAEPWPGLLSGGPNAHPGDAVARKLPAAPPMRMWVDDQGAYSMNEVAINWNAPLVFVLAAANSAA